MIVNPTLGQIRGLKGIIYGIRNKVNGKYYIGQTINTFYRRYRWRAKWWQGVDTPYLKASLNKYGPDNFEIVIFEEGITDIEVLNRLEHEYALRLKSYYPTGYNLKPCGTGIGKATPEMRKRYSRHMAKEWRFKNICTGETFHVTNLNEFAKARGLKRSPLGLAITLGKGHSYRGYVSMDTTQDDIDNLSVIRLRTNMPTKPYTVWKAGQKYEFNNIPRFMTEHGIKKRTEFCDLLCGKISAFKGFSLSNKPIRWPTQRYRNICMVDSNGRTHVFENFRRCVEVTGILEYAIRKAVVENDTETKINGYRLLSYEYGVLERLET